jgi:hypothetical protein
MATVCPEGNDTLTAEVILSWRELLLEGTTVVAMEKGTKRKAVLKPRALPYPNQGGRLIKAGRTVLHVSHIHASGIVSI